MSLDGPARKVLVRPGNYMLVLTRFHVRYRLVGRISWDGGVDDAVHLCLLAWAMQFEYTRGM